MFYGSVFAGPIVKIRKITIKSQITKYECEEGHQSGPGANFCSYCGSPVGKLTYDVKERIDDFDIERVAPNLRYLCPFDIKEFYGFIVYTPCGNDKRWDVCLRVEDVELTRTLDLINFRRDFKEDLDAITELVGEENVTVEWRIVSCS